MNKIPGKVYQHKLLDELANHGQISLTQLQSMIQSKDEVIVIKKSKTNATQHVPSLMQQAISLLVQYPELATQVTDNTVWQQNTLPGANLFAELVELLQQKPLLTTGSILEHWRDKADSHSLQLLASRKLMTPENGLTTEFNDTLNSLQQKSLEQQLNYLQRKLKQGELDTIERQQYMQLLTQRKTNCLA